MFIYQPLSHPSEIRIAELLPGQVHDPISCRLRHRLLDDSPSYDALSYAWGDPEDTETIRLDNIDHQATKNLCSALQHLRSTADSIYIWIDALCINQLDGNEKSRQIPRMIDIYRGANRVVAWIGDYEPNEESSIQTIFEQCNRAFEAFTQHKTIEETARDLESSVPNNKVLHELFAGLLKRPWFSRKWVVQEVANSRSPEIVCGHQKTSFMAFTALWMVIKSKIDQQPWLRWHHNELDNMYALAVWVRDREARDHDIAGLAKDLSFLLQETGSFNCTLPHDRIYAILGLLGARELPPELVPDYGLPFHRVYHNYTRFILQGTQSLDLLHSSNTGFLEEHLPSWIVDFANTSVSKSTHDELNVSVGSNNGITFSADGFSLNVSGLILGLIGEVSLPSNPGYAKITEELREMEKFDLAARAIQTFQEAIIQKSLIIRGIENPDSILPGLLLDISTFTGYEIDACCAAFHALTSRWQQTRERLAQDVTLSPVERQIWMLLYMFLTHRPYFLLQNGTIGRTMLFEPRPIQVGDVTCSLRGANEVCILRRAPGTGLFNLVAFCVLLEDDPSDTDGYYFRKFGESYFRGRDLDHFVIV